MATYELQRSTEGAPIHVFEMALNGNQHRAMFYTFTEQRYFLVCLFRTVRGHDTEGCMYPIPFDMLRTMCLEASALPERMVYTIEAPTRSGDSTGQPVAVLFPADGRPFDRTMVLLSDERWLNGTVYEGIGFAVDDLAAMETGEPLEWNV